MIEMEMEIITYVFVLAAMSSSIVLMVETPFYINRTKTRRLSISQGEGRGGG